MLEVLEDRTLPAPVTLLGVPNWIAEGPAPNADGQDENIAAEPGGGANAVSGAIQAIAVNPGNSANVFVGTVNGGIWRTTNFFAATTPWTPLTDQFPALEISALQFDPTDGANQTVVAGIGNTSNIITTLGPLTGLLKTTDGGASWAQLGNTAAQGLQGENVSAVLPRGATILVGVVSGAAPGLYRTTNNGSTFQLISGLNNLGNGPVYDVAADPSNNNRAYVVVGGATGGDLLHVVCAVIGRTTAAGSQRERDCGRGHDVRGGAKAGHEHPHIVNAASARPADARRQRRGMRSSWKTMTEPTASRMMGCRCHI